MLRPRLVVAQSHKTSPKFTNNCKYSPDIKFDNLTARGFCSAKLILIVDYP